jgi:O-antigen/teichoic acid export membrane protein
VLDAIKKTKLHLLNSVIAVAINIVLNLILIQSYGVLGAAMAMTATFILIAVLRIAESYYYIKAMPFNASFIKAVLAVILSGSIVYYITQFLIRGYPNYVMITFGMVFFFLYALFVLVLRGLDSTDVMILNYVEDKTGIKIGVLRKIIKRFT